MKEGLVVRDEVFQTESAENEQLEIGKYEVSFCGMLSQSPSMRGVFDMIHRVAPSKLTVLILGESGTGKELIARSIHEKSLRRGPLVAVNCGAIPEEILESELFGHEKGSFTGAVATRQGKFQRAHTGTIFLDEIGEMSPKLQVKLLRVIQEKKVDPVGSSKSCDIDVRIIAATNKNLFKAVENGTFREDLFYRLSVVPIELPALREREHDAVLLSQFFLIRACKELNKNVLILSEDAKDCIKSYNWPGNIRELENLMERLAVMVQGSTLEVKDLPTYIRKNSNSLTDNKLNIKALELPEDGINLISYLESIENDLLLQALNRTNWNKKAAADLLKLNRTTLIEKLKKKRIIRTGLEF
jgi:transcriptional regulator with PAS, ATPase and Fis domain